MSTTTYLVASGAAHRTAASTGTRRLGRRDVGFPDGYATYFLDGVAGSTLDRLGHAVVTALAVAFSAAAVRLWSDPGAAAGGPAVPDSADRRQVGDPPE